MHFYPVSGIWELRISRLGEQDAGEYDCQVREQHSDLSIQKLHQCSLCEYGNYSTGLLAFKFIPLKQKLILLKQKGSSTLSGKHVSSR